MDDNVGEQNSLVRRTPRIEDYAAGSCCIVCHRTKYLKRCAECQGVFYCSEKHQRTDWPTHRQTCQRVYQIGVMSDNFGMHPINLPISTGQVETLSRHFFAKLLRTFPEDIEFGPCSDYEEEGTIFVRSKIKSKRKLRQMNGDCPAVVFSLTPRKDFRVSRLIFRCIPALQNSGQLRGLEDELQELQKFKDGDMNKYYPWTIRALWLPMNGTHPILVRAKIRENDGVPKVDNWIGHQEDTQYIIQTLNRLYEHGQPIAELRVFHVAMVEPNTQWYANQVLRRNGVPLSACPAGSILVTKSNAEEHLDAHLSDMEDVYDYYSGRV